MPWIAIGPFRSEPQPAKPSSRPPIYHSRNISIEMLIRYRSLNRMKLVIDFCETYLRLIDATEEEMQQDLADRSPYDRDVMIRIMKVLQLTKPSKDPNAQSKESRIRQSKNKEISSLEAQNRERRNKEVRNRQPRKARTLVKNKEAN
jgi:hypothetical protein